MSEMQRHKFLHSGISERRAVLKLEGLSLPGSIHFAADHHVAGALMAERYKVESNVRSNCHIYPFVVMTRAIGISTVETLLNAVRPFGTLETKEEPIAFTCTRHTADILCAQLNEKGFIETI
jgi:hypothetical protein